VGALRLPLRPVAADHGRRLLEAGVYLAVIVVALALAYVVGDRPFAPMLALAGGTLLVGWMAYSARFEVTLAVFAAYLLLADGYLKLRFQGQLSLVARDALLLAVTFGAFARWVTSRAEIRLPPLTGWVAAWVIVILAQLANPANGTIEHSVYALRPHIEFVPLFFLGYAVMRTKARLKGFLWLLVALTAINGLVGLIQINLTPDQLAGWGPGYAGKIYGTEEGVSGRAFRDDTGELRTRPFALGSDQGFGGALGVLAAPAALALLALGRRRQLWLVATPLAAGTALAVITSQARVALLGSVAAVGIYVLLAAVARKRIATLVTVLLAVVVTALVVSAIAGGTYSGVFDRYRSISPDRVVSTAIDYRRDTVATIPSYAWAFPLGAGLGTVGPGGSTPGGNGRVLNGESQFTFLLVEAGIAGFIIMVGFNLRLLYLIATRVRRLAEGDVRLILAAMSAPLFAKCLSWFGGPSTAGVPDSPYMWFVAGVLVWWLVGRPREPSPAATKT
jgi:hypothetical protein